MAMPFQKILLSIIHLLAVLMLVLVQGCSDMAIPYYPGAKTVFDRDYGFAKKVYQLSADDFSTILAWYENALQAIPHESKAAPQEADIPCVMKEWSQQDYHFSVTVCDYLEHRTISTQVLYSQR